jgi:hypothetical protein
MRHSRLTFLVAFLVAALAVPVLAQKITGTIRGTVTDPSGGVIAGAKVTVKNEDTGLTRVSETNSEGIYSFAELPVGSYRVEVEQAAFKSAVRSRITLNVADTRAVDVQLETGNISEVVDVEVAAVAVKTVGADVSGVVTGEQARELPLNGRNFMQLTFLQPGVVADEGMNSRDKGLAGGSDVSVSGGGTTANVWTVDGANNNDVGSNRTILVYPSVDAIEEFKIQRNNYGAEFGQAGGAHVNLVTRGGTNDFHGSLYYYARRDRFNAIDYFLDLAGQEAAPLKWDDYGGTIGGPILKDKLHFFYSQEWNKDEKSDVRVSRVPTQAERNGDFSSPIPGCNAGTPIDPLTGQPFPGNIIPANRISPGGRLMISQMALPNTNPSSGCNNWTEAVATPISWRQENARVDWTVSDSTRVMLRYTQDSWKSDQNLWGDDPFPTVSSVWNQPGKIFVAQLNKTIGSSMVNALTFSYSMNRIEVARGGSDPELASQLGAAIPTLFGTDIKQRGGQGMPMANWGSLGDYGGGVLWNQAPWLNNQDLFVVKDDYSAVFGKHVLKIGALVSYNKKNEEVNNTSIESVSVNNVRGFLGPNGFVPNTAGTGNPIANWLLAGTVWNTSELRTNPNVQQRWKDFEAYVADTYKVNSRITADLGVRLTHFTAPYEADDRIGSFDPGSVNRALGNSPCNGILYPPGTNPCAEFGFAGGGEGPNRGLRPTKAVLIAPRLGLAWDVFGTGKTAIRGGLGLFYARERLSMGLGLGTAPPFSGTASVDRTLDSNQVIAGQTGLSFGAPGSGLEQSDANPHNWQWNVSVQHELLRNTILEVAYVGNKGGDLLGITNANEVAPANRLQYARTGDVSLRPLNGVTGIGDGNMAIWTHDRSSIYHGLQTALVSRFGRASQASLSYTWSKLLANTGLGNADGGITAANVYTDSTQPHLDRGRASVDKTHIFAGSLVLALPTLEDKGSFARNVFGDWEITSIVQASSGYPITVYLGGVPGLSGNGSAAGTGYVAPQRPNRVPGVDCRASGGVDTQWLNPAAWTINNYQIGTNGDSGRGICDGPGYFAVDGAVYKNIRLGKKVKLQLRAEVFNIFNRTNFLVGDEVSRSWTPQNVVFDTGDPRTATRIVSATPSPSFGQLTDSADNRQAQLGIRLSF